MHWRGELLNIHITREAARAMEAAAGMAKIVSAKDDDEANIKAQKYGEASKG